MKNRRLIQEKLELVERRLAAADEYVARNVNIESNSFLHFSDWNGNSGHPKWMKNYMIPRAKRAQATMEKNLEQIRIKRKRQRLHKRRCSSRGDDSGTDAS